MVRGFAVLCDFQGGFGDGGVLFVVFAGCLAEKSVASVVSGRQFFDDEKHARFFRFIFGGGRHSPSKSAGLHQHSLRG